MDGGSEVNMKLKFSLASRFLTVLSVLVFSQGLMAQDAKIGILNPLQALFNSDSARIVQEELEQEFAADEARAQELSTQLNELREKFQQDEA